jgi:MscS family membrane protein
MRAMRTAIAATCLLLALSVPGVAVAQLLPRPSEAPSPAPADHGPAAAAPLEAPDSPRASARAFLELTTRKGDFARAARYLVLPPEHAGRGTELARRMRSVIEQSVVVNIDALSPLPGGEPDDGLPDDVDRIGSLDVGGTRTPVYVVRTADRSGAFWAFSPETVAHIDAWYDALPDRWVRDWMPESLQRHGPFGLMWWQWLALPLLTGAAYALGRLLAHVVSRVVRRLVRRTTNEWDDELLGRIEPALRLFVAVVAARLLLPVLVLLPAPDHAVRLLLNAVSMVAVFWGLWLSVGVWRAFLMGRPWAADNPSARSLLSVAINFVRLLVAVTGVLAVLAVLGYPVTTVVAGLGIGGIALAFGAQKTIENLFGSVSLAVDQPFRVGDFVRIEDFTGNVERIGMRSTQIRTLDRTTVTLPNGKLSELKIEGFGTRDRIRFATTVGLVYGTTEAQMRRVVLEIERMLRGVPEIWPDTVVSKFAALGPSSLDIEVLCWFQTSDVDQFRRIREDVLLGILRIVEDAGTSIAYPTRTVYVETPGAASTDRGAGPEPPRPVGAP